MIPYGHQLISAADIAAVTEVLQSDWLTQGPAGPLFERALADLCQSKHALGVSSATAALHLACLALEVGQGDRVWTSPNTFVASANCARYCGAEVDFVDIDPRTRNMCAQALAEKLRLAALKNALPKVLIPVHFSGEPCDMAAISALAKQYGIKVIEDASHAIGARYKNGSTVGGGQYAELTVFSFHPVKIITTAEGGALLCQDDALFARLNRLRSHGITRDSGAMDQCDGPWYYQQLELGFNYRLSDLQAALGRSQLNELAAFIQRRRDLAHRYHQLLAGLPIQLPVKSEHSAWHLYVIEVDAAQRAAIFSALRAADIGVNVHYIPVHLQPYYREFGFKLGDFPNAEAYYAGAITLPLYANLSEAQQDFVVSILTKACQ
ncbi:UDP-4-amino-4,6-dideoxy-N-acetyl-beta-L-altrosamine transaminase [Iodobacter arcticus]|uniref:UDP-4-amino-4, 6-dideoxy-N-acetyl-beta-L-altrosamine transaminase n=1 Tax=Iodobacter arcticus TaxID=590593 RepID=A0ABW2QX28_9NEIS